MYCTECGAKLEENSDVCLNCGKVIKNTQPEVTESGSTFAWGILGFFIPLVGLILFFVLNNTKPKAAKSAGIGALISTAIVTVMLIFGLVVFSVLMSNL